MALTLYVERRSLLHSLHPVTKMVALLLWCVAGLCFTSPKHMLVLLLLLVGYAALGKCLVSAWRLRYLFLILFLFSAIAWSLFGGRGHVVFRLGPIAVGEESIRFGIAMGLRFDLFVLAGIVFLSTTRVEEFTSGLSKIGVPFGVSFAFTLAFRLLPMFLDSTFRILQAQRCRGLDVEHGSVVERIKKYVPLIVPVFMTAVRGAESLAIALESKGFGAPRRRTYYQHFRVRLGDVVCIVVLSLITLTALCLRLAMHGPA